MRRGTRCAPWGSWTRGMTGGARARYHSCRVSSALSLLSSSAAKGTARSRPRLPKSLLPREQCPLATHEHCCRECSAPSSTGTDGEAKRGAILAFLQRFRHTSKLCEAANARCFAKWLLGARGWVPSFRRLRTREAGKRLPRRRAGARVASFRPRGQAGQCRPIRLDTVSRSAWPPAMAPPNRSRACHPHHPMRVK